MHAWLICAGISCPITVKGVLGSGRRMKKMKELGRRMKRKVETEKRTRICVIRRCRKVGQT